MNVKELEILTDVSGVLVKKAKPDFKKLGPRYGKLMKQIAGAVAQFDQEDIARYESQGVYSLELNGEKVELEGGDLEISTEDIPGWLVMTENGVTVALDITISEELRYEGIARELVNRIQNLRKDSGLEVTDRIEVQVQKSGILEDAIIQNKNYITSETLAEKLELVSDLRDGTEVEFDDVKTQIALTKI